VPLYCAISYSMLGNLTVLAQRSYMSLALLKYGFFLVSNVSFSSLCPPYTLLVEA